MIQMYHEFLCACIHGRLRKAKWIFANYKESITINKCLFRLCCFNGQVNVVKWLFRNGLVPQEWVFEQDCFVFKSICGKGDLQMAKCLWKKIKKVNNDVWNEAFLWAHERGQAHITEWLLTIQYPHV
jgi:hypothetical protein